MGLVPLQEIKVGVVLIIYHGAMEKHGGNPKNKTLGYFKSF